MLGIGFVHQGSRICRLTSSDIPQNEFTFHTTPARVFRVLVDGKNSLLSLFLIRLAVLVNREHG